MKQPPQPSKRKPGRPKLEQSETKINILRIGAYLFMEIGYDKVSLELVAKRCEITKASVYYYYSNKATLFTECIIYVLDLAYRGTISILTEDISTKQKLIKIAMKQMSNAHMDFEAMMRDASKDLNEEQISTIRESESKLIGALTDQFEQAIKQNEVSSTHDPSMLAHLFTAMFNMKNHLGLKQRPLEEIVETSVGIFWEGAARQGKQSQP